MNKAASTFDLSTWREQFIRSILRIVAVFGIVLLGATFPTASPTDKILFISLYALLLGLALLPAPYSIRAYFLLAATLSIGINAIASWGPWADGNMFLLSSIILASLLLDNKTDAALLVTALIVTTVIGFLNLTGIHSLSAPNTPVPTLPVWRNYIINFLVSGAIITTAANMLKSAFFKSVKDMENAIQELDKERLNLEQKVRERTSDLESHMNQLRTSAITTRAIAEVEDTSSLLAEAANLIASNFEYYQVKIFILDDNKKTAYLQASSKDADQTIIGQIIRLESNKKNPLTIAAAKEQVFLSSDLENNFFQDTVHPFTRSRAVLPLNIRGNIFGLIDIHSDQPNTFSKQDAEILQNMADLTAILFDNVRLLNDTKNLLAQLENSATAQTKKTWSKLTGRHKSGYQYTPAGVRPIFAKNRIESTDGYVIPIVLHGQTIGKIKLKKRKGISNEWSEREQDIVEKISVQVALALENSRLVDEAQKNALRNQMIANFSTYVRETLDLDAVVRTAAAELRKVFDLKEAEIIIGSAHTDISSSERQ